MLSANNGTTTTGACTKSNKRGAGKFICAEMGADRISSSEIIRHEDSKHNTYTNYIDGENFSSGFKLWDYIEKQGDTIELSVQTKERVRKL